MKTAKRFAGSLLLAGALAASFLSVGCANYQKDVTRYERVTPFESSDGSQILEERTTFETSLNQERTLETLTVAVDSEYTYNPETLEVVFKQPQDESGAFRGGGFYMSATGYRTAVNVESVAQHTDRDEVGVETAGEVVEDIAEAAIEISNPVPSIPD